MCLENMSKNIKYLERQDREIYYKVIKNLIRRIHDNHEQERLQRVEIRKQRRDRNPNIDDSDESDTD